MARASITETRRVRYEEDLYAWSLEQVASLRARRGDCLDWDHLAEEIEWMVGRDRRELKNRLRIILLHLLKWQGQPGRRGASWRKSLRTQRRHIKDLLQESPSLRRLVPELMDEAYPDAIKDAIDETGSPRDRFPADCPYAPDDVLDEDHLPEASF
ncbi:MAG: DUF29 domain-containing protein [Geminicoccaceae bacterium]